MGLKDNAIGIGFKGDEVVYRPDDICFVVLEIGPEFHNNLNRARDLGLRVIVLHPSMLGADQVAWGNDSSAWKSKLDPVVKLFNQYLLCNGVPRILHGIMIDASETNDGAGKQLTSWWITEYAERQLSWLKTLYSTYKVFHYENKYPVLAARDANEIQQYQNLMHKWGVCTNYYVALDGSYPKEGTKPIIPADDGKIKWKFWLYSAPRGGILRWMYNGTPQQLDEELGIVPVTVPVEEDEPVVIEPEDEVVIPEITPDYPVEQHIKDIWQQVFSINKQLAELIQKAAHIKDIL